MKHYNISLVGKVQGVFMRKTACEAAKEMGVKGEVRNLEDGSVLIRAEAPEKVLNAFLVLCSKGSENSRITNIYVEEGDIQNFKDFKIVEK